MNDRPMYETAAALIEAECRDNLAGLTNAEDMLAVAFKAAHNHWMFTNEQDQFKVAIVAVLITLKSGPEFDRVNFSLRSLRRVHSLLNALQSGVPVDWEALEKQSEDSDPQKPIPLNQMWCDVKWPERAHQANLEKTLGVRE